LNILNKGRCSRCIASKVIVDEIKKELQDEKITDKIIRITVIRKWLYCVIKSNFCRYIAMNCKEPPMGVSADDYNRIINSGVGDGQRQQNIITAKK